MPENLQSQPASGKIEKKYENERDIRLTENNYPIWRCYEDKGSKNGLKLSQTFTLYNQNLYMQTIYTINYDGWEAYAKDFPENALKVLSGECDQEINHAIDHLAIVHAKADTSRPIVISRNNN